MPVPFLFATCVTNAEMIKLSATQKEVLLALAKGYTLKAHRYLSGTKLFKLHPLEGPPENLRRATVEALYERGLIESNMKFPAATYLLTPKGREVAEGLEH